MSTDWSSHFALRTGRMEASAIRELLKITARPEVISFAGGLPAAETFPVEAIRAACEQILSTNASVALQYAPTEGYMPLREYIAAMYRARGVPATVDNVLITTGSQQGLDLLGRILIDEGDLILTEAPTYVGALQAWRPLAPHFASAPTDLDGMQIDQIDPSFPIKLLYLLPNFQNPSGISLCAERRQEAVTLAHRQKFLIVEDDPYRALRYSGQDSPALVETEAQMLGADWNAEGRIIHLGTFSKIMAPALRIGWMLAPAEVIRMATLAKQGADLHTSTLNQCIAVELLANGVVDANLPNLISLYRERRDMMMQSLQTFVGELATWTHPAGGLFIWVTLLCGLNSTHLLTEALKKSVAFVSGDSFFFDGRGTDSMRLNFSCTPPETIRDGVRRLGEVIAEQQPHPVVTAQ